MSSLLSNIRDVTRRISRSAMIAERDPNDIKLVAVSKTVSVEKIIESANLGIRDFGESRVQEAEQKIKAFTEANANHGFTGVYWHMIGSLQKNKVKTAVKLFDLIHSVDSLGLAEEINKWAEKSDKIQRILIQVKLSDEDTKHGINENDILEILENIKFLPNLQCIGLMTIPPYSDNPETTRPYFKRLKELLKLANEHKYLINELSMGMSNDFEVAIQEGATIIRIGTAIYNAREDPCFKDS